MLTGNMNPLYSLHEAEVVGGSSTYETAEVTGQDSGTR